MLKTALFFIATFCFSAYAETGILILAHGSMAGNGCDNQNPTQWERYVLDTVKESQHNFEHESEVAFGMWNTACYQSAIERLEKKLELQGKELNRLLVLPLFISSHSAVIEMQKFIFKKRADRVIPLPHVRPISFDGEVVYMSAMDYDPRISFVLANRLHKLKHMAKEQGYQSSQMETILIMHGPVSDEDNTKWLEMGQKYLQDVNYLFPTAKQHLISLRDDAPADVRNAATKELRAAVQRASTNGRTALILPLLLSSGGIEAGILKRLEGLEFVWSGKALLPDQMLSKYLVSRLGGARASLNK